MDSPGIRYSKSGASEREEKTITRYDAIDRFSTLPGSPKILTFPGDNWITEKAVQVNRKDNGLEPASFICIENDKDIFKSACLNKEEMLAKGELIQDINLELADFRDLDIASLGIINAAWTDFVGQLRDKRMTKLKELWNKVEDFLIITSMIGRWRGEIRQEILNTSLSAYLQKELTGCHVHQDIIYNGRPKMHYIVLGKRPRGVEKNIK